jgi:hypothetical protein
VRPIGGWSVRVLAALMPMIAVAACASDSPALSTADPLRSLLTIDQLVAPDFTVSVAAAHVGATTLAGGDPTLARALMSDGLQSAASVEYQRGVDFGTSNGPIDVVATVERFGGTAGASSGYTATVIHLDAMQGAVPTSTGPLGDQAHAISVVRSTQAGIPAVEITVVWRTGNLVNVIVARGRYGGTRLNDALVLAGLQTQNDSGSSPG